MNIISVFDLICFALCMYVVLDGMDLGLGILSWFYPKDASFMIDSFMPFWDANETWLILALVLLMAGFPHAQEPLLAQNTHMLVWMVLGFQARAMALYFRALHQNSWHMVFAWASLLVTLLQGLLLSRMLHALHIHASSWQCMLASILAYCTLGASWRMAHPAYPASLPKVFSVLIFVQGCMFQSSLWIAILLGACLLQQKNQIASWRLFFLTVLSILYKAVFFYQEQASALQYSLQPMQTSPETLKMIVWISTLLLPCVILHQAIVFIVLKTKKGS